jgi:hypothetical protein
MKARASVIDKEAIAKRYGFSSFDELVAASSPLPMAKGDLMQCYVARHPGSFWFIWECAPEKTHGTDADAQGD